MSNATTNSSQRSQRKCKIEANRRIAQQAVDDHDMGALIQHKVPYLHHSFTRVIGYDLNDKDSGNLYKLADEGKLGIMKWCSVPFPNKNLPPQYIRHNGSSDNETIDPNGYSTFSFWDNEKEYLVSDGINLLQDDPEYKQQMDVVMPGNDAPPWFARMY